MTVLEAVTFALVMAAGQFSPGPDMLLILKNSMAQSRQVALTTVLGTTTGIIIHTTVAITGLAAATRRFPGFLNAFWLAGACYLGWLGSRLLIDAWRSPPDKLTVTADESSSSSMTPMTAFLQGFITNLTNPKVFLFFTSMLAAFLPPDSASERKLVLGGILIVEALVLWSVFVLVLQWPPVARTYANAARGINAVFGILLLWIAATVFWHQT